MEELNAKYQEQINSAQGNTEFNELQLKAFKNLKQELTQKYGQLEIITTLENIL